MDYASNQLPKHAATTNAPATATTSQGAPVDSLTASQTAGAHGPIVLQDFTLIDHMAHFDRERIPERVVHAKGAGAFGYFEVTDGVGAQICKADFLASVGRRTPVAVRFSTVGGESGSSDTARDPRGFAVKFYTSQGNWDLVGNNTPIFFLRDPILFPSFIHTQKRNPVTHLQDANMFWDFISLRPETTHQVSFLFADRGIPCGYRFMNGYGSHTFKNVNQQGEAVYVKYHFKTDQGIRNYTAEQAREKSADDPDSATRDLFNAIAAGDFPSWTLYVQVMTLEQAATCSFDPFDLTKIWPHASYPLQRVGRLVLNRNPDDYFANIEQLAFAPSHMVPGIEPSPDKMLQARLFSYPDTHRHRLGANYHMIPVNQPRGVASSQANTPGMTAYQRDGPMQVASMATGGGPNYFPNSFAGPKPTGSAAWHKDNLAAAAASPQGARRDVVVGRYETGTNDNFSQVRDFYCSVLDEAARERLTTNMASHLSGVTYPTIQARVLQNLHAVHPDYAHRVSTKLAHFMKTKKARNQEDEEAAKLSPPRTVPKNLSPAEESTETRAVCPFGFRSRL